MLFKYLLPEIQSRGMIICFFVGEILSTLWAFINKMEGSQMATNLKINVYKKTKLETSYSIPCKIIKLGTDVVPAPVIAMMESEGISIDEIAKLSAKPDLVGTLVVVEHHVAGDKIVVELD